MGFFQEEEAARLPNGGTMKRVGSMSILSLEVLAKSLSMHLTLEEIEWLCRELKEQAEARRPQSSNEGTSRID